MPGLYHSLKKRGKGIDDINIVLVKQYLQSHPDIEFRDINLSSDNNFFVFANKNYPIKIWNYLGFDIVIIGMIYNLPLKDVQQQVRNIVRSYHYSKTYQSLVRDFVDSSDGDFIVYAFSKNNNTGLLFNDILGRLPLYYYSDGKRIVICSEQKGVLHNIPKIKINKFEVINMILFSQTLGENTMFSNVKRLLSGKILTFNNNFRIVEENSASIIFHEKSLHMTKQKIIEYIASVFAESVKNRVDTLTSNGYKLIADLTGGFDSRIVFGALANYTKDVNYYTFEYIQDESIIAKDLFFKFDSPGEYAKLEFSNKLDENKIADIVFKTDCLVNYYTSSICYNDVDFLYNYAPKVKTARFGGLGGEFFRHPYKLFYKNIFYGIKNGFYNSTFDFAFESINCDKTKYTDYLQRYINDYYSGSKDNSLKGFYFFEYYRVHVGLNAEDRERIHFWSVHPLWSKDLIKIFANEFLLKWASYDFFTKLMKEIDNRLLDVAIFNRKIKLEKKSSRIIYDICENYRKVYKQEMRHYFKNNAVPLFNFLRRIKRRNKRIVQNKAIIESPHQKIFNTLEYTKHVFNEEYFRTKEDENIILKTIVIYFAELEKRYPEKFKYAAR